MNIKQIIKEELQAVLEAVPYGDEPSQLGAGRTIEEVWQSLQDSAGQAHSDLQMLAIHLCNAGASVEEVDAAANTLEGIIDSLDQDVKRDLQQIVMRRRRGD